MRITTPRTPGPVTGPAATAPTATPLDPTVAAALFAAWSGDPIVIIDSPPGAGKTRLITHLAHALASRARLRVAITGQTRIQVADLAGRLAALGQKASLLGGASQKRPAGLHRDVAYLQGHRALRSVEGVVIATTSRWLTKSWRLGPDTTGIIQPAFYPSLPFTSARPPMHLTGTNGHALPEITTAQVSPTSEEDPAICRSAANRVRALLDCTLTDADVTRPLTLSDVAVITPRVHQASLVAALLADLDDVLIGTANAAQGAERAATVVIHPLTGQHEATPFNTDAGRTCVALTRHKAHATVITDPGTPALLTRAIGENPADTWLPVHARLWEALHAH